jgi:hypothetical protein
VITFLRFLFCFSLLATIAIVALVAVLPPINPFLIYILLFGLSLLPFLLVLIGLWRGLIHILKELSKSISGDAFSQVIALGLTSFFFVDTINQFMRRLLTFLVSLASGVADNLIRFWQVSRSACPNINSSQQGYSVQDSYLQLVSTFFSTDCFSQIFNGVLSVWNVAFNNAYRLSELGALPFGPALSAIGVWVVFAKALQLIRSNQIQTRSDDAQSHLNNRDSILAEQETQESKLYTLLRNPLRDNILFFLVLGVGVYLSIASIAAIPSLQDTSLAPQAVSVEQLRKELNDTVDSFNQSFKDGATPFSELSQRSPLQNAIRSLSPNKKESTNDPLPTSNASNPLQSRDEKTAMTSSIEDENRISLLNYLNIDNNNRGEWINKGERMLLNVKQEIRKKADSAETEYEISSASRKGNRETVEHFLALTAWLRDYVGSAERQVNSCVQSIEKYDKTMNTLLVLIMGDQATSPDLVSSSDSLIASLQNMDTLRNEASSSCSAVSLISIAPLPLRPELGNYLGPFQFVASWLLRTESLPLTLITGLIGFGLLGAACSSFVRERLEANDHTRTSGPLITDLPKVIVIGLSAAILAFLAVMGGLAVFFTTGSNPNPYALLLACLIAAVFGEDVWRWARSRLQKNLSQDPSTDRPPQESNLNEPTKYTGGKT